MKGIVTSTANPRVVEARKLQQKKHRTRQKRFAAEGLQILGMAAEVMDSPDGVSHIQPETIFYCEALFTTDTAPRIRDQLADAGAEAIQVSRRVIETLSDRISSQGLFVTFAIEPLERSLDSLRDRASEGPQLFLTLDRPQYPGNIGTLIRTADAVGAKAVIVIEPAGDPFDPKCVRASMGSLFAVPLVRLGHVEELRTWRRPEVRWVAADPADGQTVWRADALHGSVGLILGNEGEGIQDALREIAATSVKLPQRGHAESLNVSVAGGILMYEWFRVNHSEG
jgi:RNA methyltransferase, TrmH family